MKGHSLSHGLRLAAAGLGLCAGIWAQSVPQARAQDQTQTQTQTQSADPSAAAIQDVPLPPLPDTSESKVLGSGSQATPDGQTTTQTPPAPEPPPGTGNPSTPAPSDWVPKTHADLIVTRQDLWQFPCRHGDGRRAFHGPFFDRYGSRLLGAPAQPAARCGSFSPGDRTLTHRAVRRPSSGDGFSRPSRRSRVSPMPRPISRSPDAIEFPACILHALVFQTKRAGPIKPLPQALRECLRSPEPD